MANLAVSKKVSFVGSWLEDVLSNELFGRIANQAKTKKGKKMKVKVNELGMRLAETTFLATGTRFFPIKSLQMMKQNEEFPACVMCVLSDPNKKYKVIALRCETEADAVQLTNFFADIRSKTDSGNWTLSGRTDYNANRHLLEVFNEHKQPNGDITTKTDEDIRHITSKTGEDVHHITSKTDEDVHHIPILDAKENHKNSNNHHKDVYITNDRSDIIRHNDHNDDDDFVIETEVETHPYVAAEIHAGHDGGEVRAQTRRFEHVSLEDRVDADHLPTHTKHMKHMETVVHPTKPVVYRPTPSGVVSSQPKVYHGSSRIAVPAESVVYGASTSHSIPSERMVYGTSTSRGTSPERIVYGSTTSHSIPSEPVIYSAQRSTPSQPVIYRATSSRAALPQPVIYGTSTRSYEPTFSATSAGYYTNPWAQRRVSRDSSVIHMRPGGNQTLVKFDQQSVMSNTSRFSRSSRLGRSELSIPTTIQRSIENVYPQPVVVLRRAHGYVPGYRVRPASYHARTSDLKVYYEDDRDRGMLL
ncbi:unnamed protein product [Candidula unifasciata]|uniref:Uncharacterized protein n=1 Tax=Candidula unifasciata TaxID=100452 RepID=A0A8S3ZIH0_9EUPU|nr:unnamed protein product [Candidula unifasciata]